MKDILNSVKSQIRDRTSSPLFGAFCISWLVWNHLYFLILFSDYTELPERLELAKANVFPNTWAIVFRGFVYPLVSSVIFILTYPHPARWLFSYWHSHHRKLMQLRQQIEDLTPLSMKQSNEMRIDLANERIDLEKKIAAQKIEIDLLRNKASSSSRKTHTQNMDKDKAPNEAAVDENILKVISIVAKNGGEFWLNRLVNHLKEPSVRVSYYIDQATELGLIKSEYSPSQGDSRLTLTGAGRKFAVKSKII